MLASGSAGLLVRWQAYKLLEPSGFPVEDRRHAEAMMVGTEGRVPAEKWRYRPPVAAPARRKTAREIFGV